MTQSPQPNKAFPELQDAMRRMLDAIDASIRGGGYEGAPIEMYLAGGMAVNYYCGTRLTGDVDASFSKRVLLPFEDLVVAYTSADGTPRTIYLDSQYNASFALLHEDFQVDARPWVGGGIDDSERKVQLKVLAPADLATSKLARFLEHDQEDIQALLESGLTDCAALRQRTEAALSCFVGNAQPIRTSLEAVCRRFEGVASLPSHSPKG